MSATAFIHMRPANSEDYAQLAELWLEASILAHDFINPTYWVQNKSKMQHEYLPMSEVYIAESGSEIKGFIALIDNQIAAIFVAPPSQGQGIGGLLIAQAKHLKQQLSLNVYQANNNSVQFYLSKGFQIAAESVDEQTGAAEYLMRWEG